MTRTDIRNEMRERRRCVSDRARDEAALQLAQRIVASVPFQNARKIAAYMPFDGEMNPAPLIAEALAAGKEVYLPVVCGPRRIQFTRYSEETAMRLNRFGIPEPAAGHRRLVASRSLDLVLAPLVAFDLSGNRLGMGAGYYDRCFAYLRFRKQWVRPRLLGVAYDLQRVDKLDAETWDVPLHGVVTERAFYLPQRQRSQTKDKNR